MLDGLLVGDIDRAVATPVNDQGRPTHLRQDRTHVDLVVGDVQPLDGAG